MKKTMLIAVILGATSVNACTSITQSQNKISSEPEIRVVRHEGSDVQVSWNPAAKTTATLTYSNELSIWSHAAKRIIDQATGCTANASVMSFPTADEGFKSVSMPIRCE